MNFSEWAFHDVEPIYLQLIQKIEYAILSRQLSAGEKLPSVREMAKLLHISPNTVMKAYTHLKHLELVVSPTNRHYSVTANEQYIFQKREEKARELSCSYLPKRRAKPHFDGGFPQDFGYAQIELCPFLFIGLIHGGVLLRRVPVP